MDKLVVSSGEFTPVLYEILASGRTASMVVSGWSMRPYLKPGRDRVHLRTPTQQDLRPGQILLFKRPDQSLILHRVRRVLPDGRLVMNGDAQAWCETISADQVIGGVASVERKGRHIPSNHIGFRLWSIFWYPTRPIRPVLIKLRQLLRGMGLR